MEILRDYNLSELNTFGIKVNAKFFIEIASEKDLTELFNSPEFRQNEKLFLGGGSNVLFTKDFEGIVVLNKIKGIEILKEDSENVLVRAMGGEIWHDLVMFAVNRGYWGIENLSLIPGTVGAAPVQNIGAYGVEIKDVLENVEAFEVETGIKKFFSKEECGLDYRDSIFKNKAKGKYFISAITVKLGKINKKNVEYKSLKEYLEKNRIEIHNPKDVSDVVVAIRQDKLPDPKILGNAGSFFKNVYVDEIKLKTLQEKFSDIPFFREGAGIKIPAGWLVEQCGPHHGGASWKEKRIGNVGVYEKQALVLVNYGGASGEELVELAKNIIVSVEEKFSLELVPEVNIV
ncbi:MAG: UDP-N-acetylmuramate dehydrogenase [Candidatus Paceibacterota bacterium]